MSLVWIFLIVFGLLALLGLFVSQPERESLAADFIEKFLFDVESTFIERGDAGPGDPDLVFFRRFPEQLAEWKSTLPTLIKPIEIAANRKEQRIAIRDLMMEKLEEQAYYLATLRPVNFLDGWLQADADSLSRLLATGEISSYSDEQLKTFRLQQVVYSAASYRCFNVLASSKMIGDDTGWSRIYERVNHMFLQNSLPAFMAQSRGEEASPLMAPMYKLSGEVRKQWKERIHGGDIWPKTEVDSILDEISSSVKGSD